METKDTFTYLEALGKQESSGRYYVKNWANYLGMYQMGEAALIDAGYYKPSNKKYDDNINHWDGEFTGKNNVFSVEDFLCNVEAQEDAIRTYQAKTWKSIKDVAEKYDGKMINGIKMTKSGMLAGAHLVGHGGLKEYLRSNGKIIPKDAVKFLSKNI